MGGKTRAADHKGKRSRALLYGVPMECFHEQGSRVMVCDYRQAKELEADLSKNKNERDLEMPLGWKRIYFER